MPTLWKFECAASALSLARRTSASRSRVALSLPRVRQALLGAQPQGSARDDLDTRVSDRVGDHGFADIGASPAAAKAGALSQWRGSTLTAPACCATCQCSCASESHLLARTGGSHIGSRARIGTRASPQSGTNDPERLSSSEYEAAADPHSDDRSAAGRLPGLRRAPATEDTKHRPHRPRGHPLRASDHRIAGLHVGARLAREPYLHARGFEYVHESRAIRTNSTISSTIPSSRPWRNNFAEASHRGLAELRYGPGIFPGLA